MKNLKFLFLSLFMVAFLAPNVVDAQAEFFPTITENVWTNITINEGDTKIPAITARALVTPSGVIHLKAEYQLPEGCDLIPKKGSKKATVFLVRFRYESSVNTLYTKNNVKVKVNSDGVATLVEHWKMD